MQARAKADGGEDTQSDPVGDEPQIPPDDLNVRLMGAGHVTGSGYDSHEGQEYAQQDLVLQYPGIRPIQNCYSIRHVAILSNRS